MTIASRLEEIVGPNRLLTQLEDLVPYSFDATPVLNQLPQAVVFTRTVEEVIALLKLANETKTPVVTRGSGTGLSGGSVPVPGCVALCTTQMNQILTLDAPNLTMLVEPGVLTEQIALRAESAGLFYPPDPGSMKISTIGGNIAEDSGGLRGLKYGVTRDYVMALEVVLPTGELLKTGSPCVKDAAGYSLRDLFVGSEGTLGVIHQDSLEAPSETG
jgi:glycolate oxidase